MRSSAVSSSLRRLASKSRRCSSSTRLPAMGALRSFSFPPPPPAATTTLGGGGILSEMTKELPHMDVVHYEHKNRKWTLKHVDYFSNALAVGFLETGLQPGDVVLSWLPQHFSESMVLQFACSKAGFVLYHLDPALAMENPATAKTALAKALEISRANVLISQEAGSDVNYVHLTQEVIPELEEFDFAVGMPFVAPEFPHLRFPIHTGFDQDNKWGWLPLKHMLVPSDTLDFLLEGSAPVTAETPLAGQFEMDGSGIPIAQGKSLSQAEVAEAKLWPSYSAILNREFHEVHGVGVVW